MQLLANFVFSLLLVSTWTAWGQSTNMKAEIVVAGTFSQPVYATYAPGDFQNLFVVEQATGRVRILNLSTKTVASQPFVTATNITSSGSEQGLLGLAFHPNYQRIS